MPLDEDQVIFEFRRIGAYVKVSAFDPVSLTEISITGAASASEKQLTDLALRKLRYRLEKRPS